MLKVALLEQEHRLLEYNSLHTLVRKVCKWLILSFICVALLKWRFSQPSHIFFAEQAFSAIRNANIVQENVECAIPFRLQNGL